MTLSYFYGARIEQSGSLSQLEDIAVRRSFPQILRLLAVYYLVQGLLLAAVGVGGLLLVDQNHLLVIKQWLQVIHLDPENRSIHWLLTKVLPITDQLLETVSIGSFVCRSLVHGTQGKKGQIAQTWNAEGAKHGGLRISASHLADRPAFNPSSTLAFLSSSSGLPLQV